FITIYITTHGPFVGPRRFIILLALIILVFSVWYYGKAIMAAKQWPKYIAFIVIAVGLTFYYQAIRTNLYQPEVRELVRTGDPIQVFQGIVQALRPLPSSERIPFQASYFRTGPFDILYTVIETRGNGNTGTHGLITLQSFLQIIPRVLLGDLKNDYTADNIMAAQMGICSYDCSNSDIATSLSSTMIADFGFAGLILPPVIVLFSLLLFSHLPKQTSIFNSILTLFWIHAAFEITGNVEGALVDVLASLRNAALIFLVLFPLDFIWTHFLKHPRVKPPQPELASPPNESASD
ncbi:MAG TPA: hypothetical protein VN376_06945, partial [Longilinea sp.]|nr:hypothetical protein [Longilinea sp.]